MSASLVGSEMCIRDSTYDQYLQFKGMNIENDKRQVVIYARVSTKNQKDDLQNQVAFLRHFCNAKGIILEQCIEGYGNRVTIY